MASIHAEKVVAIATNLLKQALHAAVIAEVDHYVVLINSNAPDVDQVRMTGDRVRVAKERSARFSHELPTRECRFAFGKVPDVSESTIARLERELDFEMDEMGKLQKIKSTTLVELSSQGQRVDAIFTKLEQAKEESSDNQANQKIVFVSPELFQELQEELQEEMDTVRQEMEVALDERPQEVQETLLDERPQEVQETKTLWDERPQEVQETETLWDEHPPEVQETETLLDEHPPVVSGAKLDEHPQETEALLDTSHERPQEVQAARAPVLSDAGFSHKDEILKKDEEQVMQNPNDNQESIENMRAQLHQQVVQEVENFKYVRDSGFSNADDIEKQGKRVRAAKVKSRDFLRVHRIPMI